MACAASRTFSTSRSNENSGVWTPMTTRPRSRYFSDHARTKASVRSQLMQVYVQKSTRTTFSTKLSGVSGDEFSQPVAPSKPGKRPSTGNGAVRGWRRAPKRLTSSDLRPRRPRTRPGPPAEECLRCRPQKSRANKRPGIPSPEQSPPDGAPLASPLEKRSSESDAQVPSGPPVGGPEVGPFRSEATLGLAQRPEGGPQLGGEELRLLPGGEVAAPVDLVEVSEAGVDRLDPAARGSPDLAGERREADGNRDRRRSLAGRKGCGLGPSELPVRPGRRRCGAGQPVQRDVVEDGVAGEIAHGFAVDERAGDLVVAVRVVVEQPGRQPDR